VFMFMETSFAIGRIENYCYFCASKKGRIQKVEFRIILPSEF